MPEFLGDRYQTEGWKNTTIKDCYSVSPKSGYSNNHAIILSAWSSNSKGYYQNNLIQERNYYLDGYSNIKSVTGVQLYEVGDHRNGAGSVSHDQDANGLVQANYSRYAIRTYVMKNASTGKYFVAAVNAKTTVEGKKCYIDGMVIRNQAGNQLGKILYYIDSTEPANIDNAITNPTDLLFVNARETWRTTEGIIEDGTKMETPLSASVEIKDGKVTVFNIQMPNGDDPFAYEVKVVSGQDKYIHKLYTENGAYNLPSDFGGNPKVYIRAVSMYEDVEVSNWLKVKDLAYDKILPDPDVQINLVPSITPNTSPYHAYRFSLNNLSDYMATDANGKPLYPNWKVEISVPGASDIGTVTLDSANTTVTKKADSISTDITYQMTAKASVKETGSSAIQASKEVSTPIYLPKKYKPVAALSGQSAMGVKCQVEGTTLDDLAIKVELDSSKSTMETPPVYRVELVGDWEDSTGTEYKDVVFAQSDVLIVSGGQASAILTDFADYLARGKNFKIRIWYAASGLGPVYTYYPVNTEAEANVKELIGETDGTPEWNYMQSTVLKNTGRYFEDYQKLISNIFTWLNAPVLDHTDTTLTPDMTDGALKYTFTWDTSLTDSNPQYEVSLVGIDSEGREVVIDTGDAYKQGDKRLVIDGSDWNYTQVKLKVTRIGNSTGKTPQIGLSSTGTYTIKPRLSQPGQAAVNNIDVNELNYELTWAPISSESAWDCAGYQAYIRAYNGNTLGAATKLGDRIPLVGKDGEWHICRDCQSGRLCRTEGCDLSGCRSGGKWCLYPKRGWRDNRTSDS